MPIFWEDNYFPLLSGEKREVCATFGVANPQGAKPAVELDGRNVSPSVRIGVENR